MQSDCDRPLGRMPSLVLLCQRVASNHADAIYSLDGMRYDLVKPILENCSAETLLRLEQTSADIERQTGDIWKGLCFRSSMKAAQMRESDVGLSPESWRDQYFTLQEMEAQRFEELKSRLRTIRQEADERKKESQIKLTDRLPPLKRARWGTPYQPKSLVQKTRSEVARMQKGIYGTPMIPPMLKARTYRQTPSTYSSVHSQIAPSSSMSMSPDSSVPSQSKSGSRVTVTAVAVRRYPTKSSTATSLPATKEMPPSVVTGPRVNLDADAPPSSPPATTQPLPRPASVRAAPVKQDPKSSIFMPKHRAHSQLPTSRNLTRT